MAVPFHQKPDVRADVTGRLSFPSEIIFMKTGECRHCGKRFPIALRQGKDSYKARAGRERSYQDQRYCSATCRKLASKARRARLGKPLQGPVLKAATHLESPEGSKPFSGVTNAPNPINLAIVSGASKSTLPMTFGGYTVVPDTEWLFMYRVRRPDGSLTDMVNLTRARDAARCFAEQEYREKLARAA
jgi:hypothetical protein